MYVTTRIMERRLVAPFTIASGVRRTQRSIRVEITDDAGKTGVGEASGVAYRGETPETMASAVAEVAPHIETHADRQSLRSIMPPGGARAAIDAALWHLESSEGRPAWRLAGLKAAPKPVATATTISLGAPITMGRHALSVADRPLLKVKLGRPDGVDAERARAVRVAAPNATLIADGNGGCSAETLPSLAAALADLGYKLLEQPLPPGADQALRDMNLPIPLCADESLHTCNDMEAVRGIYQYGNIKLDKSGGLTEAMDLADALDDCGMKLFVGCMLGGSVSIAPAFLLTPDASFVDLDGPLWMAEDSSVLRLNKDDRLPPPALSVWGG
ncbi:MAG: dipeptide epimerase [Pseudomonadota bacterium]